MVRVLLHRASPFEAGRFAQLLSAADHARAERFRREADRDRSVTAAGLLRVAAAELVGVDVHDVVVGRWCRTCSRWGDHGRPTALGPDGVPVPRVHLSATHAGDVVLVAACADAPLGVDVELVGGVRFRGFDTSVLTPAERADMETVPAADRDTARARVWTRKESLLKATGHGLAVAPRRVGFAGTALREWPPELGDDLRGGTATADLADLPPGHVGAVTVLAPTVDLTPPAPRQG